MPPGRLNPAHCPMMWLAVPSGSAFASAMLIAASPGRSGSSAKEETA
jgi:hypothetical protein